MLCTKLYREKRPIFTSLIKSNKFSQKSKIPFVTTVYKKDQTRALDILANSTSLEREENSLTKKLILVFGATGTLGRQIVRKALEEGYSVRCVVRPREIPADFLREWGATVVNADLNEAASIPPAFVGVHTVIDASTARPEESISKIDWVGKLALIQTAEAMDVQRYIFYSILDCDKHPSIPLMSVKTCTENFLAKTKLNFTTFRLCSFMQATIGNFAIPILEERSVWGTDDDSCTAYMDTQDIARLTLAALENPGTIRRNLTLTGPKVWTTKEVIDLCVSLSTGSEAKITSVPTWVLKTVRVLLSRFRWSLDASDRLAFTDVAGSTTLASDCVETTYELLGVDPSEITTLEDYLKEYYENMIKKLKAVGAESRQTDFYV